MYGWRGRIGIIYPASGLADHEFWAMVPAGVSVHVTRVSVPVSPEGGSGGTLDDIFELSEGVELAKAARDLATVQPHCIAWMCTSCSFGKGPEWNQQLIKQMEEAAEVPATTTTAAIVAALRALGVRRVACASPYLEEVGVKLKEYLEAISFEVVNMKSLNLRSDLAIGSLPPAASYNLALEADVPEAECIVIPETAFRTVEIIEALEEDLGKPIVTAIGATMWHSLRLAGIQSGEKRLGRLFELDIA